MKQFRKGNLLPYVLRQISLVAFLAVLLCGCTEAEGSDPVPPLRLDQTYYEVMSRGSRIIPLSSGSDRISATVGDTTVLRADSYVDEGQSNARIVLHGLKTGGTTLTLTDEVTGLTQTAEVKVTDTYLNYVINESNHPALQPGTELFLVNNEARDCYFFYLDNLQGTINPTPIAQGTYEFFVRRETDEGEITPYLRLSYPADENGNFTADAPIAAHEFLIDLSGNTSGGAIDIIRVMLDVDWQGLIDQVTTKDIMQHYFLQLSVPGTDYVTVGEIGTNRMPEHILE